MSGVPWPFVICSLCAMKALSFSFKAFFVSSPKKAKSTNMAAVLKASTVEYNGVESAWSAYRNILYYAFPTVVVRSLHALIMNIKDFCFSSNFVIDLFIYL